MGEIMKCRKFLACGALALGLAACGDDASSGVSTDDVVPGSSDAVDLSSGDVAEFSSGNVSRESSSSEISVESSSSELSVELSSSDAVVESSSSVLTLESSVVEGESLVDSRDGKTYKTVKIGNQVWMAENLNFANAEGSGESVCYNNVADSCVKYGRLYTWAAAMDSAAVFSELGKGCGDKVECKPSGVVRGICPEGWHLPSHEEWNELLTFVGEDSGIKLKSTSGWQLDGSGTDDFGFSGLPVGEKPHGFDIFSTFGIQTYFWSGTEDHNELAIHMKLDYALDYARLEPIPKGDFISVRCLKDPD